MFMCEQCGSRYSARYAVGLEVCPRCQVRGSSSRLSFSPFRAAAAGNGAMRATATAGSRGDDRRGGRSAA